MDLFSCFVGLGAYQKKGSLVNERTRLRGRCVVNNRIKGQKAGEGGKRQMRLCRPNKENEEKEQEEYKACWQKSKTGFRTVSCLSPLSSLSFHLQSLLDLCSASDPIKNTPGDDSLPG